MFFFNHYYLLTRLLSFACQEALSVSSTTRGAKCLRTLCSYQELSLCLVSQVTLRSSTFASSIDHLLSPTHSTTSHLCLSQAYGCSDRYTTDGDRQLQTRRGHRTILGKSSVSIVMERDISLTIVPRNSDDPVNNASGNHTLAPVAIAKPK